MAQRIPLAPSPNRPEPPERPNRLWNWGAFLDYRKDPLAFYVDMARLGDLSKVQLGRITLHFINHPDFIQQVLQQNHRTFKRSDFDSALLGLLVGHSVLTASGDAWLRQRRLMQPAFHRKRIASFGATMTEATQEMLVQWGRVAGRGEPLDIWQEMMRLTLRIVGRTLFSVELDEEASGIGQAVTVGNQFLDYRMRTFPPAPLWLPTPRNRHFKQAKRTLDRLVLEMIAVRRAHPDAADDLLTMLLEARDEESGEGMSDEQLRDEMITLIIAGHETTANALAWTLLLLAQHPDAAQPLYEEVDRVLGGRAPTTDDLASLPYTRMTIEEGMRLYPPAWAITRQSVEEQEIGGFSIPSGSIIVMLPYAMHRHPAFWEEPERFDPTRFTPERVAARPKFAYFPFGGGPRLCIGNTFAMTEAQLILATIAQRYRMQTVSEEPVGLQPLITLRPQHGIPLTLHERAISP